MKGLYYREFTLNKLWYLLQQALDFHSENLGSNSDQKLFPRSRKIILYTWVHPNLRNEGVHDVTTLLPHWRSNAGDPRTTGPKWAALNILQRETVAIIYILPFTFWPPSILYRYISPGEGPWLSFLQGRDKIWISACVSLMFTAHLLLPRIRLRTSRLFIRLHIKHSLQDVIS